MDQPQPKSNSGTLAAIIGGVVVAGGIAAAAAMGSAKKKPLRGPYPRPVFKRKPCGCGR